MLAFLNITAGLIFPIFRFRRVTLGLKIFLSSPLSSVVIPVSTRILRVGGVCWGKYLPKGANFIEEAAEQSLGQPSTFPQQREKQGTGWADRTTLTLHGAWMGQGQAAGGPERVKKEEGTSLQARGRTHLA